jgi:hypothetical protein
MAHKAIMKIEEKDFLLLELTSHLQQKTDAHGRPVSQVHGGELQFAILGTDDDLLANWATDKKKKHDGTISLFQWEQDTKFRTIDFKNAFVTFYAESFCMDPKEEQDGVKAFDGELPDDMLNVVNRLHEQFGSNYLCLVKISAEQITVDGVAHDNKWY